MRYTAMRYAAVWLIVFALCIQTVAFAQQEFFAAEPDYTPEELGGLQNAELVAKIQDNPGLLQQRTVLGELEQRAMQDPGILNTNPVVKDAWFKHYDLIDKGVTIKSLEQDYLTTKGISTRKEGDDFGNVRIAWKDFPGAEFHADGSVVIDREIKVEDGTISKSGNAIMVENGATFIKDTLSNSPFFSEFSPRPVGQDLSNCDPDSFLPTAHEPPGLPKFPAPLPSIPVPAPQSASVNFSPPIQMLSALLVPMFLKHRQCAPLLAQQEEEEILREKDRAQHERR